MLGKLLLPFGLAKLSFIFDRILTGSKEEKLCLPMDREHTFIILERSGRENNWLGKSCRKVAGLQTQLVLR